MNEEAIELLVQQNPRLERYRTKLAAMQPGAYCVHRSWGMGEIQSYDAAENRLIINFGEGREEHAMDPAFCADKLKVLEAGDLLVKAKQDPAWLSGLAKDQPADLVVHILDQSRDKASTALEIENVLQRLLGPTKAKKWWTATKKLLVKDPRVATPTKKTEPYVLRSEPVRAEDEVLEEFFETKAPKKKIKLAARLIDLSVSHKDIVDALPDILEELAQSLAETKQLSAGERLHGVWIRNDLARFIHADPEALEPTSASIIRDSDNLSALAEAIPAAYYGRFLDLLQRTNVDTWERDTFELLKHSSGKFTAECVNFLLERDLESEVSATLNRWLLEQNLKAPVLMWILKNRHARKYTRMLDGLMAPRLLNAIFFAIDNEALQNTSTRRIPLAEFLSEDQELIGDLLALATPETAYDLAQALMLNQGFEDLSKKSLLARFIKLFPGVQQLVGGDTGGEATESDDELIVSQASLDARTQEYDTLVQERIPKNKQDIAEARAHGDLRENAEYKMARQEQDILLARKSELELEINRARVTDFTDAPEDRVGVGSLIELQPASASEPVTYAVLGAWDGDPDQNILSYKTPLARALMGRKTGETVEVEIEGHREAWTIRSLGRYVDRQVAATTA